MDAETNGNERSLGTSTMTRFTLLSRVACSHGEDEIKKLVIDYRKEGIKNALRRQQLGE
jgi:hypothetical protein